VLLRSALVAHSRFQHHPRELWDLDWAFERFNDVSSATPITYSVGGKQYLAVPTGQGGFHAASYAVLVPELVSPPDRSAMLWVFELP
jgi:hypothetical protein